LPATPSAAGLTAPSVVGDDFCDNVTHTDSGCGELPTRFRSGTDAVCAALRDAGRAEGRWKMATIPHEPRGLAHEGRRWSLQRLVPETWAALAIVVMWLAVLFDAIFGPDIVNATAGGDHSTVPSAVAVAFFAFLATWVVARYGFRRERDR
jgi:hypothetical protein